MAGGIDIASIRTLMDLKSVDPRTLDRILDAKGVRTIEELDGLTIQNFLQYLLTL